MTKKIQAFFRNENDAEAALAKLQKLKVSNAFIDAMPDGDTTMTVIPINNLASGGASMNSGPLTTSPPISARKIKETFERKDKTTRSDFSHLLEFEVSEEEAEKAIQELCDTDAHIDEAIVKEW